MAHPTGTATSIAAVLPTAGAQSRLRPISAADVTVSGGFWGARLEANRERTIPAGYAQLEGAGTLHNFALAAGAAAAGDGYRALGIMFDKPFPFLDSDVYKWLEGAGWELGRSRDPRIAEMAEEAIGLVQAAQRPDGYLNTFVQVLVPGSEYRDLEWGHELYCFGHLLQAALAWHRALGDDRLLVVAERAVDSVERALGSNGRVAVDGHPEIEMALVELYRATGERRHLDLAATFIERRGRGLLGAGRFGRAYWQDHLPVARGAIGRRPRGAPDVPRLRCRRRRGRDRGPRAPRCRPSPLARHGRDADVPHRRPRQPPQGRGVRRSLRAAARPRLCRDLRGDRLDDARRMGIQEIIWDCKIWLAGSPGMRRYSACYDRSGRERKRLDDSTAHRNHVHIGLNWPGAREQTSFWDAG